MIQFCESSLITAMCYSFAAHMQGMVIAVQPKESGAPKTGDMMLGRPVAKFYEAVTTTEQTLF